MLTILDGCKHLPQSFLTRPQLQNYFKLYNLITDSLRIIVMTGYRSPFYSLLFSLVLRVSVYGLHHMIYYAKHICITFQLLHLSL